MRNDSINLSKNEMIMVMHDQEQEIEKLKAQVSELQAKLDNYEIKISNVGSLAEASAQINDLFVAAQATVDTYIEPRRKPLHRSALRRRMPRSRRSGLSSRADCSSCTNLTRVLRSLLSPAYSRFPVLNKNSHA